MTKQKGATLKFKRLSSSFVLLMVLVVSILPTAKADAATTVITITSPHPNQVIQRDTSTGLADIAIRGTTNLPVTALEASSDGFNWTPVSVNGLSYDGELPARPTGRMTITVRSVNEPSVNASVTEVGVGDVFAAIGDSNTMGYGLQRQNYTGSPGQVTLLTNQLVWKSMTGDPVDWLDEDTGLTGCVWVFFICVRHALYDQGQGGSVWPIVATSLSSKHPNLPIGLVVMARSGSYLNCNPAVQNWACWQKPTGTWVNDRWRSLYADMSYRLRALSGSQKLTGVIWFEGVNDVFKTNYSGGLAEYQTNLARLVNDLVVDFGPLDVIVSQPGDCAPVLNSGCTNLDIGFDNVRSSVAAAWLSSPHVKRGPVLYDINKSDEVSSDGLHYRSNGDLQTAAVRLDRSIESAFYGAPELYGPRLLTASRSGANVELLFDKDVLTTGQSVGGLTLKANGVAVSGIGFTANSSRTAITTLSPEISGVLTVSLGAGRAGQQANLPFSADGLPAEIVLNLPISYSDPDIVPPTGSMILGGGASQTTLTTVSLAVNASDDRSQISGLQLQLSNQPDLSDASWRPLFATTSWQIPTVVGIKTVYGRLRDEAGNISPIFTDTIELVASQGPVTNVYGTLNLEGGIFAANIRTVDLLGTRGSISWAGITYTQRNDISRCGAGCVQGSAWAWFKPTIYWTADIGMGRVTVNGVSRQITGGTLQIVP